MDYLLAEPSVMAVFEREAGADELLHAPALIDAEVLQALRGLERGGQLPERDATAAAEALAVLRVVRHPLGPLRERVWELRHELTAYDAYYLALAEALAVPRLLTGDKGLAARAERVLGPEAVIFV